MGANVTFITMRRESIEASLVKRTTSVLVTKGGQDEVVAIKRFKTFFIIHAVHNTISLILGF